MTQGTRETSHREIGLRIRRGRLRTGLSLEKFAPLIGISRRHLIRLENGENRPRPALAARIEQVLADHGQPVREPILGDAMPPFGRGQTDVAAELVEAVRLVIREEFANSRLVLA